MLGHLSPLFPKFGGQVANFGGIHPSLALDTTLLLYIGPIGTYGIDILVQTKISFL